MKRFIIFFALSVTGWCASYDPFLLDTQLTLLPKIAMLDKNIAFPHNKSPIKILIAYEYEDEDTALSCTKILMNKFNGVLNGHPIVVTTLPFDKLDNAVSFHLIYALKTNATQLKKVHNAVSSSGTLTALYDADKLSDGGILLSIRMERAPVILINAKILRENRISFPDSLLEIARII
ncbi:MAG: YfiR/HmsC family protein [Sulfuricurvum sp.]|nr:YfiR/HmsC family protein [Sulfuricurvum sp.]